MHCSLRSLIGTLGRCFHARCVPLGHSPLVQTETIPLMLSMPESIDPTGGTDAEFAARFLHRMSFDDGLQQRILSRSLTTPAVICGKIQPILHSAESMRVLGIQFLSE